MKGVVKKISWLVKWCFEPSQPLVIISGLKETFVKRYIVERTNKVEVRPEEQSEKTESCRENSGGRGEGKSAKVLDRKLKLITVRASGDLDEAK